MYSKMVAVSNLCATVDEVAQDLNQSVQTVRDMIKTKELPASKVRGRYVILRPDITDYLQKDRV